MKNDPAKAGTCAGKAIALPGHKHIAMVPVHTRGEHVTWYGFDTDKESEIFKYGDYVGQFCCPEHAAELFNLQAQHPGTHVVIIETGPPVEVSLDDMPTDGEVH